jgi:hypothetical protein
MKKIFGLLLTVVILASCSDDAPYRDPGTDDTEVLLKKMVVSGPDGQETSQFEYDGEKLMSITHSNGSSESYNYIGSALNEIRYYQNGGLVRKDTYLYSTTLSFAGFLAVHYDLQNPSNTYAERFDYTFQGDAVTIRKYTGTESQQTELTETKVLTILNNNIKKEVIEGGATTEYAYDYKNAPLKNVTLYNILALAKMEGGINNEIGRNVNGAITSTSYTYTEAEYPATATITGASGNYTITYTY